ncbi:MAG: helix-turn-helix transcriptional regulator [Butyrivibrio sp.]|nr:helix-turn-helix transcriptional regulator [Butyrivibrio sp.]
MTLKASRVNKNLTLEQASKKLGVSKDTLSNWERGKTFPSVIQVKKIEELYGVSYNDLIFLPNGYGKTEVE